MANVLIDEAVMMALASLLREATGGNTKYYPAEMEPAFRAALAAGGGGGAQPVLAELEVDQNGVYIPGVGVDGFSKVTVNVPASTEIANGIVVNATDANGNWTDVTIYGSVRANMFDGDSYLERVTIADGVTEIGQYAFRKCTKLSSVALPAGLRTIAQHAFNGCTALPEIDLPAGLQGIANDAFNGCTALTALTIPASVTSVGNSAFRYCSGIETVCWNPPAIASVGSSSYPPFRDCSGLTDIVIADNVTVIPSYLCKNCAWLVSVVVPDSVMTIGTSAFEGCSALERVQIGESDACAIATINSNAFKSDTALLDITIYAVSVSGSPWGATNATVTWVLADNESE